MIGSVTKSSTGKKILSIFVALAMVLTMSNISAYYASAQDVADEQSKATEEPAEKSADNKAEETKADEPEATADEADEPEAEPVADEADEPEAVADEADEPEAEPVADKADEPVAKISETKSEKAKVTSNKVKAKKSANPVMAVAAEDEPAVQADSDEPVYTSYTVEYYLDGVYAEDLTKTISDVEVGKPAVINPNQNKEFNEVNYTLNDPFGTESYVIEELSSDAGANVFRLYYEKNANKDAYLDKYQMPITFKVVDGYWADGSSEDKIVYATFMDGDNPSEYAFATADIASLYPEVVTENASGEWNEVMTEATRAELEGVVFEYTYYDIDPNAVHGYKGDIKYFADGNTTSPVSIVTIDGSNGATGLLSSVVPFDLESMVKKHIPEGYVLDTVDDPNQIYGTIANLGENTESITLSDVNVYIDTDEIGKPAYTTYGIGKADGIADKKQVIVTFAVENGKLKDSSQSTRVVTPNANGNFSLAAPGFEPYEGYENDSTYVDENGNKSGWQNGVTFTPNYNVKLANGNKQTLTYTYAPKKVSVLVPFVDADTGIQVMAPVEIKQVNGKDIRYGDTVSAADIKAEVDKILAEYNGDSGSLGYIFDSFDNSDPSFTAGLENAPIGISCKKDANKDGIADDCQATVTFKVVNGTMAGYASATVTKFDSNGDPAVNGIAHLTNEQIPAVFPAEGYEGGTWAPYVPTTSVAITNDIEFTYTFTAIPPVAVDDDNESSDDPEKGSNSKKDNSSKKDDSSDPEDNEGNDNPSSPSTPDNDNNTVRPGNVTVPGVTNTPFVAVDNQDAAVDGEAADEATDEETVEETIEETDNALASPDQDSDDQIIVDDENALADYEDASFNWVPYVIIAGVIVAGGIIIAMARRRENVA